MNKLIRILYIFFLYILARFINIYISFVITFQTISDIHVSHASSFTKNNFSRSNATFIYLTQTIVITFIIHCIIQEFYNLIFIKTKSQIGIPWEISPWFIIP